MPTERRKAEKNAEKAKVLIIDDDEKVRSSLQDTLRHFQYQVHAAEDAEKGYRIFLRLKPEVILLDIHLPGMGGLELLKKLKSEEQSAIVVMITGFATIESAVHATQLGAYAYLEKPVRPAKLLPLLEKALETYSLQAQVSSLQERLAASGLPPIIGKSRKIRDILNLVKKVASSPSTTVLVQGESGTGKELVAKAIHMASDRGEYPFMALNCAALTETLLEAELFGYERGAFTGATCTGKIGLFRAADGGVLFLDEIGEMNIALQAKLLRVLQEKSFKPVGGTSDVRVDVRIIASTNRDLEKAVQTGAFRKDLFFRLNVSTVSVPPLRERKEDIPLLAYHFLSEMNKILDRNVQGISEDALQYLVEYSWPGNVRELRNVIEHAVIVCASSHIQLKNLSIHQEPAFARNLPEGWPLPSRKIRDVEKILMEKVLKEEGWNIKKSAGILGVNRTTLYKKIKEYGIQQ